MSMLSRWFEDMRGLLLPRSCVVCGQHLPQSREVVCSHCEATAPLTNLWCEAANPMNERFWGLLPVERASALFWYVEGSPWREAVHRLKYAGRWRTAYELGRWYGALILQGGLYGDVDAVLPVPLHWWRRMWRGYNQSEYIAEGLAREMGVELLRSAVVRHRYNVSQTSRHHHDRWQNVEGIFRVRDRQALQGRHILLVDDVFTTGATIISLGETILKAVPDVKLSVAVLATTHRSLHQEP